jgi:hypothetical protein
MASAQLLQITNATDERVAGVDERLVSVDEHVAGVDERVAGVDDRVADISASMCLVCSSGGRPAGADAGGGGEGTGRPATDTVKCYRERGNERTAGLSISSLMPFNSGFEGARLVLHLHQRFVLL